jgi:hypothetical protein
MASMGLKNTQIASLSPKKLNKKTKKKFKQSIISYPHTHLLSGQVEKATIHSTAFNQDMDGGDVTSNDAQYVY